MNNLSKSLLRSVRRRNFHFSTSKSSTGIFDVLKGAWNKTFPSAESEFRQKYKKVRDSQKFNQKQLQELQLRIPEYQRTALVVIDQPKAYKKPGVISSYIGDKIKQTQTYKQYADFKEGFKSYVEEAESIPAAVIRKVSNNLSKQSALNESMKTMKTYLGSFSVAELEKESTYIFLDAYKNFLNGNIQELKKLCGDQALSLFKALIQMKKVHKLKRKYGQILSYEEGSFMKMVHAEESQTPSFVFEVKLMEIQCFVNEKDEIVQGGPDNIVSNSYYFALEYSSKMMEDVGHPWKITEVQRSSVLNLLV